MDHGDAGPELKRGAELFGGGLGFALGQPRQPQVVDRLRVMRLEAEGKLTAACGPLRLPQRAVGFGQVGVEGGHAGVDGDGPADELDGLLGMALLEGGHAE